MADETYYSLLGTSETASAAEIKAAYLRMIREVHPDRLANAPAYWQRQAEEKAKEINEAYTVLSDPGKRRQYDSQLASYRGSASGNSNSQAQAAAAAQAARAQAAHPPTPPPVQPVTATSPTPSRLYRYIFVTSALATVIFIVMALGGVHRGAAVGNTQPDVPSAQKVEGPRQHEAQEAQQQRDDDRDTHPAASAGPKETTSGQPETSEGHHYDALAAEYDGGRATAQEGEESKEQADASSDPANPSELNSIDETFQRTLSGLNPQDRGYIEYVCRHRSGDIGLGQCLANQLTDLAESPAIPAGVRVNNVSSTCGTLGMTMGAGAYHQCVVRELKNHPPA